MAQILRHAARIASAKSGTDPSTTIDLAAQLVLDGPAANAQSPAIPAAKGDAMPTITLDRSKNQDLKQPAYLGWVRRFGPRGVLYEVIGAVSPDEVRIRVLTTGEEADYPIADLVNDPED